MRNRPVNQQQLARKLGLSHATVSRSLANNPAISAGTRERVLAAAAELGYKRAPTRALRKPRDASPVTVGVLIGAPLAAADRATFPSILAGIRRRAAVEHIDIDVLSIDPGELATDAGRRQLFRQIRSAGWRGVVLIYPFPTAALELITPKISAVSVLTEYTDYDALDVIDTDHGSVQALVARLAALGHARIGFATWEYPAGGLWAQRRYAAYAAGLAHAGLDLDPRRTLNIHASQPRFATPSALADAAARAMRKHKVSAWVCAADHQAYQLVADLRARGFETPRDYSITGFDGNEPPPGLPVLATLRVPNEDIGASAIAQLVSRLLNLRAARRKILVEGEFIAGKTMAGPPAQNAKR